MQGECAVGRRKEVWESGGSQLWGASLGRREDPDPGRPLPTDLNRTKVKANQPAGLRGGDGRAAVSGQGGSWGSCQGPLPSCLHEEAWSAEYSVPLLHPWSLRNTRAAWWVKASPVSCPGTQQRENLGPAPSGTFPPEAVAGEVSSHGRQHRSELPARPSIKRHRGLR